MSSLLEPTRRFAIGGRSRRIQFAVLLGLSVIFIALLEAVGLPAALFLGPMVAGIVIAAADGTVRVPPNLFVMAQGVVGCLMVRALPASVISEIAKDWPIFAAGVISVIVVANAIGLLLTRWRVLPGTTAIWGSSPGASTAMIIMAEAHGADFRLVALMQYIRMVCVAIAASVVARIWAGGGSGAPPPAIEWFPAIVWMPLLQTLALAIIGAFTGKLLRLPAGSMLVPMIVGVVLQNTGFITIELPQWLLAISYALIGWSVGLRFTRDIIAHATRVFPQILASTLLLMAACGIFGALLVIFNGVDPLTAYLATSPGGADSVAIIAASSKVDVPFVIAMQTARFLVVLVTGPSLARLIVRLAGVKDGQVVPVKPAG